MRIFVAGATGVIGRRAIPTMLDLGHSVSGVARSAAKWELLRRMGATPVTLDLFDKRSTQAAVAGHDTIVNLATSIPPSSKALLPGAWRENSLIRRQVSANLAAAAKSAGSPLFIQESFAPIYADGGVAWLDETAPIEPVRYNRAVVDAERAAQEFTSDSAAGIVLRFAYLYDADSDFTRDAISFVRKGWAPALGSPDGYISSISHLDAATAVVAALNLSAGVYNVADNEPVSKREFYYSLATALGAPKPKFPPQILTWFLHSVGETLGRSQRISNRKLRHTGWSPSLPSVREGWPVVVRKLGG